MRKLIAMFLLVNFTGSLIAPTVTYALTAGPTAPEATSFEPVDTTDLVNLSSGDLVYNLPLLEVPGPGGGYPLSLSYHPGIQPNEEASWVGLGFTLNPGAIIRNVNGYADDHRNIPNSTRNYWQGGETKTYTLGVTVGIAGTPASVSGGLSYSQDTYQGSGLGWYVGVGARIGGEKSPVGLSATAGVSPYGDPYGSVGVSATVAATQNQAASLSVGAGLQWNGQNVSGYANSGFSVAGILGGSISTGQSGASLSVGGLSFTNNAKAGQVSTNSHGFNASIPTPWAFWINLGYNSTRYWIDQTDKVEVNGALYFPSVGIPESLLDTKDYDKYSLVDPTMRGTQPFLQLDKYDPEQGIGGSFPNEDNYYVHAQGLAGSIKPYQYQQHLLKRNNYSLEGNKKKYKSVSYPLGHASAPPQFKFVNDFANQFQYNPTSIDRTDLLSYTFDDDQNKPIIGEDGTEEYTSNYLAGSRHIEWFTNLDILNKTQKVVDAGFKDTRSSGLDRGSLDTDLIGGFTIINESGVKYHFALPALSYEEYFYSKNNKESNTFNEFKKPEPYAYTWYLTAITGPDYVDRSATGAADGILNEFDWGYWVEFDYGKWTANYAWRNPATGYHLDIDNNFSNYSSGKKELYYLDAIRTRTHTAIFVKSPRVDAKSSALTYNLQKKSDLGFFPTDFSDHTQIKSPGLRPSCYWAPRPTTVREVDFSHKTYPVSSLKLDKIYLFENETLNRKVFLNDLTTKSLKTKSDLYNFQIEVTRSETITHTDYRCVNPGGDPCHCAYQSIITEDSFSGTSYIPLHLSDNVIDAGDLESIEPRFTNNALRVIEFDTGYSLMWGTSNSFDHPNLYTDNPPSDYNLQGRLTLNSVNFKGIAGKPLLPPVVFNYEPDNLPQGVADMASDGAPELFRFTDPTGRIKLGDILKLGDGQRTYHAVVMSSGETTKVKIITAQNPSAGTVTWQVTKNPPYHKDFYDIWGLYKSDYDQSLVDLNEAYGRMVTEVSSKGLDAWSLHSINTIPGAKIHINYEPDDYYSVYFDQSNLTWIKNIERDLQTPDYLTVSFDERFSPSDHYTLGEMTDIICLVGVTSYADGKARHNAGVYAPLANRVEGISYSIKYDQSEVKSISSSSMRIYNPSLYKELLPDPQTGLSHDFLSGTILIPDKSKKLGGGLRVNSIVVSTNARTSKTSYVYVTGDNKSAGISSYYPLSGASTAFFFPDNAFYKNEDVKRLDRLNFNKVVNQRILNILTISRQLPPPGVMYSEVTTEEYFLDENGADWRKIPNYSKYNYEVFNRGMVGINYGDVTDESYSPEEHIHDVKHDRKRSRNVVLKDYTSQIGALKKVTLFNDQDQPISVTINHYLHDGAVDELRDSGYDGDNIEYDANQNIVETRLAAFNNQGVIEETFTDARFVKYTADPEFVLQGVISKREQFPAIKIGQTVINHKSGVITRDNNIAFDFYSGQVVKSTSVDSYGNRFMIEQIPAFRKYPEMQSAAKGGANMLSQTTASYTYRVDSNNNPNGLLTASVQTWSNQVPVLGVQANTSNVWRPQSAYRWNGSLDIDPNTGIYPLSDFLSHPFNWQSTDQNDSWEKISQLTLDDIYSHGLESNDINGNYSSARTSPDQIRIIARAANSKSNEMAYSGAEFYAANLEKEGGVDRGEGNPSSAHAHTGKYSLLVGFNSNGFNFKIENAKKHEKYKASVWVYAPGDAEVQSELDKVELYYSLGNVVKKSTHPILQKNKSKSWYLLSLDIIADDDGEITVMCGNESSRGVYFDDFRVHPMDASLTSYVYDQSTGQLTFILDANNFYTKYEYDGLGWLVRSSREALNYDFGNGKESYKADIIIKEVKYNYGHNN